MIQVTRWLEPEELVYHKGRYITIKKWIYIEADRIKESIGVKTYVQSLGGQLSIFRDKIR